MLLVMNNKRSSSNKIQGKDINSVFVLIIVEKIPLLFYRNLRK